MCFSDTLLDWLHFFSQNPSSMKLFKIPFLLQNLTCELVCTSLSPYFECSLVMSLVTEYIKALAVSHANWFTLWDIHSFGIWHCVTGWLMPYISRQLSSDIWWSDAYAVLKNWAPITQWHNAKSQKNKDLKCTTAKA